MSHEAQLPTELKRKDSGFYLGNPDNTVENVVEAIESKRGIAVVTGASGSGKTTVLAFCASALLDKGFECVLVRGKTEPELLLKELMLKARDAGNQKAEQLYLSAGSLDSKLRWVADNYLSLEKVVLILDNFEENLSEEGDFLSPKLKAALTMLQSALKKKPSFILISSAMDIEDYDTVELNEFSRREFIECLERLEHAASICRDNEAALYNDIGGNPLVMKLLDSLIRFETMNRSDGEPTWELMKDSIPGLKLTVARMRNRGDQLIRLFTARILSHLEPSQRSLLGILAAYRFPVGKSAVDAHQLAVSDDVRVASLETGLLDFDTDVERYVIHPAVASAVLAEMDAERRRQVHEVCGRFFWGLEDRQGQKSMDDIMEARRHFLEAEQWDAAAEATFSLGDYLGSIGFLDFSFQMLVEISGKKLNTKNRAAADYAMGNLYSRYGRLTEARESFANALASWERNEDDENVPLALQQMGYVSSLEGRYDVALDFYQRAMHYYEASSTEVARSRLQHQTALVLRSKGDEKEALELFRQSVEVMEKNGDEVNVAASYLQMGQIFLSLKNTEAAIDHFEHSLDLCKGMGDTYGVGVRHYFIAQANETSGEVKAALGGYLEAWKLFSQLKVADEAETRQRIMALREKLPAEEFAAMLNECRCDASQFDAQRVEQEEFLELMRIMTDNAVYFFKLPEAEKEKTIEILNNVIGHGEYEATGMEAFKIYFQMLSAYIYHEDYTRFRSLLPAEMWAFFERARMGVR